MATCGRNIFKDLVPPAALAFAALGSIMFDFATRTERAGARALLLTLAYRRLTCHGRG